MRVIISPSALCGTVTAPPSKSAGHRALICAALCDKDVIIRNLGNSDDMTATVNALSALGSTVTRNGLDVTVTPLKRNIEDVDIDFLESGSTARFIIPVAAALGVKNITFKGRGRLPERPFSPIISVLTKAGITCSNDKLPTTISGKLQNGTFSLPGNISSQYISGLLLALSIIPGKSVIELTSKLESAAYVDMTVNELRWFGADIMVEKNRFIINGKPHLTANDSTVEGDWSQAAFFLSAGAVAGDVTVTGLDFNSLQGDKEIVSLLKQFGATIEIKSDCIRVIKSQLKGITINASQIPDLVPILAVVGACAEGKTVITNAERLRIKESDRLKETVARLNAFGVKATETADGMEIIGSSPIGADITSAHDHRIVMCFSILAAVSEGQTSIDGALAINKSYPTFFEDYKLLRGVCDVI